RITVAPLGVSPAFSPAADDGPGQLPVEISLPYVLHVGDLHTRRNLTMLADAVLAARRRFGAFPALSLVLAGIDRDGLAEALCTRAAAAGVPEAVVTLGP